LELCDNVANSELCAAFLFGSIASPLPRTLTFLQAARTFAAAPSTMSSATDSIPSHVHKAEQVQRDIIRQMTPARRLELAVAMQQQMRALMDAGLRHAHPELSTEERRREIARRILHART
jgi:Spy/CpxP family protein refolding chaperone